MKDLKIFYEIEKPFEGINSEFDAEIEKLAKKHGLIFQGSGVEIATRIRDIHYRKEGGKNERRT